MSQPVTPREAALRVAVLEALGWAVGREYDQARAGAEAAFADRYRTEGSDRHAVLLPDGERIGQVTVRAAPQEVTWTSEDALEAWAREHLGEEAFEEFVPASVLASREVLAVIKAARPDLLGRRLRPATRKKLAAQVEKSGGFLEDKDEGTKDRVADVSPGAVTGAFAFTDQGAAHRRERIMQEWRAGRLPLAILGQLALPAADVDPEPEPEPQGISVPDYTSHLRPPFGDEHGFRDPVRAAAHAVMVQGGFSTPPIEAYRMIRSGGVAADRALAWLAEVGLDPADPDEGKNTPWPLPAAGGDPGA